MLMRQGGGAIGSSGSGSGETSWGDQQAGEHAALPEWLERYCLERRRKNEGSSSSSEGGSRSSALHGLLSSVARFFPLPFSRGRRDGEGDSGAGEGLAASEGLRPRPLIYIYDLPAPLFSHVFQVGGVVAWWGVAMEGLLPHTTFHHTSPRFLPSCAHHGNAHQGLQLAHLCHAHATKNFVVR